MSQARAVWRIPQGAIGTDKYYEWSQITPTQGTMSTAFSTANTNEVATGDGVFVLSGAGTVALQFINEVNNSAVTLQASSVLQIWKVA
jgi:hypothetical protein